MATIAEQLTSLANTKTAIKEAIVAKGVEVLDTDTFRSYADKIGQIQAGGGAPATKFGATVETWIGDVDENGVLQQTTWTGALNFAEVKEIRDSGLQYKFYNCKGITSADLSSLTSVGNYGLAYAFYNCEGITSVDLSSLTSVGDYGLNNAFYNCKGITSVDLSPLTSVGIYGLANAFYSCEGITSADLSSLTSVGNYGAQYVFNRCEGITSVDLSSLTSVGNSGLMAGFYNCIKLTAISFPSLTGVQTNSFGTAFYNYAFQNCPALTEIHFRADMQATIEAMTGYADKWGATNATIYFDLIGTITVNGVAYARNEPNSTCVDGTKTYVAWADESSNIVYTDATVEPAVDTVVYSDAGTTQVGTAEAVA